MNKWKPTYLVTRVIYNSEYSTYDLPNLTNGKIYEVIKYEACIQDHNMDLLIIKNDLSEEEPYIVTDVFDNCFFKNYTVENRNDIIDSILI